MTKLSSSLLALREAALTELHDEYSKREQEIIAAFNTLATLGVTTLNSGPSEPVVEDHSLTYDELALVAANAQTGADVARIRRAMGYNQSQFATLWGSTQANISVMERNRGHLQARSTSKLQTIVNAFISM